MGPALVTRFFQLNARRFNKQRCPECSWRFIPLWHYTKHKNFSNTWRGRVIFWRRMTDSSSRMEYCRYMNGEDEAELNKLGEFTYTKHEHKMIIIFQGIIYAHISILFTVASCILYLSLLLFDGFIVWVLL